MPPSRSWTAGTTPAPTARSRPPATRPPRHLRSGAAVARRPRPVAVVVARQPGRRAPVRVPQPVQSGWPWPAGSPSSRAPPRRARRPATPSGEPRRARRRALATAPATVPPRRRARAPRHRPLPHQQHHRNGRTRRRRRADSRLSPTQEGRWSAPAAGTPHGRRAHGDSRPAGPPPPGRTTGSPAPAS